MKRRLVLSLPQCLLVASACLLLTAAAARQARAQEGWPAADAPNPQAGTRRKIDEYGKIGHCDETARLDNFAIELQNEPGSKGYLLVYVGKNDMPSWTNGILGRAASYLVNSRGMDAERIKVVNAGYRESRTTELWVVPENFTPPEPSDTVEFKLDRTKAYQWDEDGFNVEFDADDPEEAETDGEEEAAGVAEAEGEAVASSSPAESEAAGSVEEAAVAESEEEAQWRKDREKYEIAFVARGVIEDEPEDVGDEAGAEQGADGGGVAAGAEAAAEPEGPPVVGEIKISLWWDVEALAEELKAAPDSRLCLVYYWGLANATRERVKEMVEQAIVKTEAQLGIKRERIIAVDGGRSPGPGVELWVVPPGAEPPKPRPKQRRNFGFYSAPGED